MWNSFEWVISYWINHIFVLSSPCRFSFPSNCFSQSMFGTALQVFHPRIYYWKGGGHVPMPSTDFFCHGDRGSSFWDVKPVQENPGEKKHVHPEEFIFLINSVKFLLQVTRAHAQFRLAGLARRRRHSSMKVDPSTYWPISGKFESKETQNGSIKLVCASVNPCGKTKQWTVLGTHNGSTCKLCALAYSKEWYANIRPCGRLEWSGCPQAVCVYVKPAKPKFE